MLRKLKNKIDNHFIRLANSVLNNKLTNLNDSLNNKMDITKKQIDTDISTYVKAAIVQQKTFTRFKDYCKNKKIVICAAGPSLNAYKPIEGAIHIALNRSILFNKVHFDFLFVQDFAGIKMVMNEILNYKDCTMLFAQPFPENCGHWLQNTPAIPESFARDCGALRFYLNNHICGGYYNSPFVKDIDIEPLAGHAAVGLSVLQFALYMNPTDIYLVGYDLCGSHFTHKNQTETEIIQDKQYLDEFWKNESENQKKKFIEFKNFKNRFYPNIKIHSINPVGLKGMFDDIFQ